MATQTDTRYTVKTDGGESLDANHVTPEDKSYEERKRLADDQDRVRSSTELCVRVHTPGSGHRIFKKSEIEKVIDKQKR